jgi:hypothetical protein
LPPCPSLCAPFHQSAGRVPPPISGQLAPPSPPPAGGRGPRSSCGSAEERVLDGRIFMRPFAWLFALC